MELGTLKKLLPLVIRQLVRMEIALKETDASNKKSNELLVWMELAAHLQAAIWGLEEPMTQDDRSVDDGINHEDWTGDILSHNVACIRQGLERLSKGTGPA